MVCWTMIMEDKPEPVIGLPLDKQRLRTPLYRTRVMAQSHSAAASGARIQDIGTRCWLIEKNSLVLYQRETDGRTDHLSTNL